MSLTTRRQSGTQSETERILCNFAERMLQVLDYPKSARNLAIPLQNLYRLLEMRRYNAWYDGEPRDWERRIRPLIERLVPYTELIDRLEESMLALYSGRVLNSKANQELRAFLNGIVAELTRQP